MHGRWVGVWLVAFIQQLLSDFWLDFGLEVFVKVVASCLLEIL